MATNLKMPVIRQVLLVGLLVALVSTALALNTGPRQIAQFEREALRCAREVLRQPGNHAGNAYVVELNNQAIRETMIKRAKIAFLGMTTREIDKFQPGNFDFATLKQSGRIEISAFIDAAAIKELISREVRRA